MRRRSARAARVVYKDESDASEWDGKDDASDYDPSDGISDVSDGPPPPQVAMKHEPQAWEAFPRPARKRARSDSDTDSDVPLADCVKTQRKAPKPKLTRVRSTTYTSSSGL